MNYQLDTTGLSCPLPILKAKKTLKDLAEGDVLQVLSTDPTSMQDFPAFAKQTGHILLDSYEKDGKFYFLIKK